MKNIIDNSLPFPSQIGDRANVTSDNSRDLLLSLGWRFGEESVPPLADGHTRISATWGEGDGVNGVWTVIDRLTSEIEAEAQAAYVARCQPYFGVAHLYRVALRRNFGSDSETNQSITEASAMAYFGSKTAAGTITPQETADAALLMSILPILQGLTPDGKAWSFPWGAVP